MSDLPSHESLAPSRLETTVVGSRVVVMDSVDSTNNVALRVGGDGTVIVADRQTAGRGRHGRRWSSMPGLGLWFTVAFNRPVDGIAFAAPLAVREALRPRCELAIKWPNDLLCNGRKVCGILVESRQDVTAVGVGINVHHRPEDFPRELRGVASSLEAEVGGEWNRATLLRNVLTRLDETVIVLRSHGMESLLREWIDACGMVGRWVSSGPIRGIVRDVDTAGALLVDTGGNIARVLFGDAVEIGKEPHAGPESQ